MKRANSASSLYTLMSPLCLWHSDWFLLKILKVTNTVDTFILKKMLNNYNCGFGFIIQKEHNNQCNNNNGTMALLTILVNRTNCS